MPNSRLPDSCRKNSAQKAEPTRVGQWLPDTSCCKATSRPNPAPSTPATAKTIALPQPNFSERFTSRSRFGWEGIPRPAEYYRRLMSFGGDSVFDLDPALDATPLSGVAEEVPSLLEAIVNEVTGAIHHPDCVPHSVADAIEWVIADIAILGIMAEATWRTQREQDPSDLKQTYPQYVAQVFSELGLDQVGDIELENLQATLNVGARVLNEIFQEEICPPKRRPPQYSQSATAPEEA